MKWDVGVALALIGLLLLAGIDAWWHKKERGRYLKVKLYGQPRWGRSKRWVNIDLYVPPKEFHVRISDIDLPLPPFERVESGDPS